MIDVKNLTKTFGNTNALDNLSLHVKKGSVYGLLGPNGAGKTTIIKHLAGIYQQDSGEISICNEKVYENMTIKSKITYIADDQFFFSQYTILDMAKFYSSLYPNWNWDRFETLKIVFPMDVNHKIVKLSKGMQKQVAFWLAISTMPEIMLLDEPVDGLDPIMRKKVWNLVLQDVADRQTSVLVSSHNLRELEDICDHIGIMFNGNMVTEKELDSMKSEIHKLQIAFAGDSPSISENINILHSFQNGSIIQLIVKGDVDLLLQEISKYNPAILDVLPLTLEEIFIYELGGLVYDIQNVII